MKNTTIKNKFLGNWEIVGYMLTKTWANFGKIMKSFGKFLTNVDVLRKFGNLGKKQ